METEHNNSDHFVGNPAFRSDLESRLHQKPVNVYDSMIYLTYTLVFIIFLKYFSKSLSEKKYGSKNKSKYEEGEWNKDGPVLGLEAIKGPKPFLPFKLIGNVPYFLPYSGEKKKKK